MFNTTKDISVVNITSDFAENGTLTVVEGTKDIPFKIARIFNVTAPFKSIRGDHAHKICTQFLTCSYGNVLVKCDDGENIIEFVLDKPDRGLLIPPGIWAQQEYLIHNSVLTVVCDQPYDSSDYIRSYKEFKVYRSNLTQESYEK